MRPLMATRLELGPGEGVGRGVDDVVADGGLEDLVHLPVRGMGGEALVDHAATRQVCFISSALEPLDHPCAVPLVEGQVADGEGPDVAEDLLFDGHVVDDPVGEVLRRPVGDEVVDDAGVVERVLLDVGDAETEVRLAERRVTVGGVDGRQATSGLHLQAPTVVRGEHPVDEELAPVLELARAPHGLVLGGKALRVRVLHRLEHGVERDDRCMPFGNLGPSGHIVSRWATSWSS